MKSNGIDSDSSFFSLSITPSGCHSDASEWVFDTSATYHICPRQEMFSSFGKLDGGMIWFGDGHTCRVEGIGATRIRLYDRTMRELKEVRYIPRMMKNLISVGALEAEGLRQTLGEGVLKMSSGLLLVLKGIRHDNLYYLKGRIEIGNLVSSGQLNGAPWNSRVG